MALVITACGRNGEKAAGPTASPTASASSSSAAAAGDFGSLKAVCGPGDASGATARGVNGSTIAVGTIADPSNTFNPGLGGEFFEVGTAFVKWCNAAGGINGRKLVLNKRDAKVLNVAAQVINACQSDFMLVATGTPLDASGVDPRVKCKLGQIPSYVVSPKAVTAALQVQPGGIPLNEIGGGLYRLAVAKYPAEMQHVGYLGSSAGDVLPLTKRNVEALTKQGAVVVDTVNAPSQVTNWRPYVEEMREKGVQVLVTSLGVLGPLLQAASNAGVSFKLILGESSQYNNQTKLAAAAAIGLPPMYIQLYGWPSELASQNPATQQAVDLISTVHTGFIGANYLSALNAWLLFATSAKACGSGLTVDCVLAKAGAQQEWTAGGLAAPKNLDPTNVQVSQCVAIIKLDKSGFSYAKDITEPNKDIFNCDPKNVVHLSSTYVG
jgi:ABC-type branched-subunit amino acid transport system substrate-binding protein